MPSGYQVPCGRVLSSSTLGDSPVLCREDDLCCACIEITRLRAELGAPPVAVDARVDLPARLYAWLWNDGLIHESSFTVKRYESSFFEVTGRRSANTYSLPADDIHDLDAALRNFLNDVRTNDGQ